MEPLCQTLTPRCHSNRECGHENLGPLRSSFLDLGMLQFCEEVFSRAVTPGEKILVALSNMLPHLRVAGFQVVFQFVGPHYADDGDAVFFQNEVLLIQVYASSDLAEIYTGF